MTTRRWRRVRPLGLLIVFAMVVAACGSDTTEETEATEATTASTAASTEATTAETEATTATTAAAGGQTAAVISDDCAIPNPATVTEIDMMGWEFPIVSQYASELEECEEGNYAFNVQFLDSQEARNQVTLDVATGEPNFEIIQGSNTFIAELAGAGNLLPLNDLIDKYRDEFALDEIDQAYWDLASIDGNIYAVPMVSNTMHVFYNEGVLNELGIAVPTTFSEALAACPALNAAGYDTGFALMLSAGWSWQIEFVNVMGALGVNPLDADGMPQWNSPAGVQAGTLLLDMLNTCGGASGGIYSTDDIQAAFQTGEYVLGQTWASRAAAMDDPEASTVVGEVLFAPALDAGDGTLAAPAYIDGYAIPLNTSVDPEQIFLAILAATDRESQTAAAAFGGITRMGVSSPDGPRNGDAAAASFINGRGADSSHPAIGIAYSALGNALLQLLDGVSVEEVLATAEEEYLTEATEQGLIGG